MYPLIHVFGRMQGNYNLKEIAIAHSITARNNQSARELHSNGNFATFNHRLI